MSELDYWREGRGLGHITPPGCDWPEGFNVIEWLRKSLGGYSSVLEFGCGRGRLAPAFRDDQYLGVDVSEDALALAHEAEPRKAFLHLSPKAPTLPRAEAAFAYTVLLHVSDERIEQTVCRLVAAAPVVYVVEIMGREWRRSGDPPVFNREWREYVNMFRRAGCHKAEVVEELPCRRYGGTKFTVLRAER